MSEPTVIEREAIEVPFAASEDALADIAVAWPAAWERLETLLGDLHGRHFYGAFYPETEEYRACVEIGEHDLVPELERGGLPGGIYLRKRIKGEPPALYEQIGPAVDELLQLGKADPSRPTIEHYRRRDEIDVLLPVL